MILLRKAKESDIDAIQEIARITWAPTYVPIIGQEQVDYMLEQMYNKGVLLEQLLGGYVFLIAELGSKSVGFAAYSVEDTERKIYKLHKLYVLPEVHGKGVGKLLINEVLDKVKTAGGSSLELNVNRHNKAKDFYLSAGFKIKETVDLDIGNGFFMNDYVMEKPLSGPESGL
ncbi:putative acetyltransferase [Pedobacter sp. BAL39]|uniref:GNAT family N-acetyltransferase n=1 Tax=Pedobacter sp. BAL39 TaxID=391596 RepID=UPI00015599DD|nr:GNAT family N-acetyltransferase [Pedobacter sp. BAL39]EDM37614.1 putative acetyltransferase [Pedobacter sp. BAL39]